MNEPPANAPVARMIEGSLSAALRDRLFRIVTLTLLVAFGIAGAYFLFTGDFVVFSVLAIGAVIIAAGVAAMRAGWMVQSRLLVSCVVLATPAVLMVLGNGIHDIAVAASGGVLLVGSLLLERRAFVLFAFATLLVFGGIAGAEIAGVLHTPFAGATSSGTVFSLVTILVVAAVGARAVVDALSASLQDAQDQRAALATTRTEQQVTAQHLRRSEEWFLKVFRASPTAIVISRLSDGRYAEVNQSWLDIFGYTREEMIGHTALELGVWQDPEERARFVQLIRERGALRDFESRLKKRSGAVADVTMSVEVVDLDGEPHLIIPVVDITDRKRAEQRIQQLATRDALTGLPNRLLLADRLALGVAGALRQRHTLAVLFIDIDRFKNINDSLGHAVGDAFLCAVAARLSGIVRSGDTLGRLGADEFLILLENVASAAEAGHFAARVLDGFAQPFTVGDHALHSGCSIGISLCPVDADDPALLIRNADTAMHHVKESGRGSYQFFSDEMNARVQERLGLEDGLRDALAGGEFELVYQPKVSFATGAVTGFEALLRWHRPGEGVIAPGRFIAVAEETGLIIDIGRWVLVRACTQIRDWRDRGLPLRPIAINLSVRQFTPALVGDIRDALRGAGIGPEMIELEITESLFMREPEQARDILRELAAIGMRVTIDDFGTGYSSLGYIKQFAVAALKIDRLFVADITSTPQDVAIIRAVIEMARALGIKVIAEGVETREQLGLLRVLDCSEYQGYYFSEPVPAAEIERLYLTEKRGT